MVKSLDREISQELLVLFSVLTGSGSGGLGGLITGTGAPDIFIKHKVGLLSPQHLPGSLSQITSLSPRELRHLTDWTLSPAWTPSSGTNISTRGKLSDLLSDTRRMCRGRGLSLLRK